MDRIAAGLATARGALAMNGGIVREAPAEGTPRSMLSHGQAEVSNPSDCPVASGLRSARVLSMLIALEALRAAPELLERQ